MPEQSPNPDRLSDLLARALAEPTPGDSEAGRETDLEFLRTVVAVCRGDAELGPHAAAIRRAKDAMPDRRESLAASLRRGVNLIVASLLEDRPMLAYGLRGAGAPTQFAYRAGEIDVHIRVAPSSHPASGWLILGQIDGESLGAATEASLSATGRTDALARAVVTADGVFRLESTEGVFDLVVHFPHTSILVPAIEVG